MKLTNTCFEKILIQNYLFEKKPKIAVAVSGGPDSIALVFLLKNWITKQKGSLTALVVDHRIRDNSKVEAYKIKKYLLLNKIPTKIFRVKEFNVQKKTMKEARDNRYEKFNNYCKKNKILHLFLGHHLDDNLETYLLRKIAGSNFEGLRSMQKKVFRSDIQILRPLLSFKKKELVDFNLKNNLEYIIDPSNDNIKYTRVIIRKFLVKKNTYNKLIEKEFEKIKYYYPFYIKMIFQILHKILIFVSVNKITFDNLEYKAMDQEIKIKILEIVYKFLKPSRNNLRYTKTLNIVNIINKDNYISLNLAGMNINKINNSLIFSC